MPDSPFAASLRWYRQQAGLTQLQLAVRSGISGSTIAKYEQRHAGQPRTRTIRALARALGVPPGRLLEPPPVSPEPASGELAPVAPLAPPCEPLSPAAVIRQGESPPLLPAAADAAGEGNPAGARSQPRAPAGPDVAPGGAAGREVPRASSGVPSEALSGAEWRKAAKAELSAQHAAQRRGRVRRKPPGITGVVVLPPGGDAS